MNASAAERLRRQIAFITEVDKLKEVFRQTVLTQSRRAENSAEHSWHFALMIVVLAEHSNHQPLDVLRILKMVLIHDLVEIDAGDTFAYDTKNMADQHAREAVAATRIFGLLPPDQAAAVIDAQVAQQLGMLETFGLIRDSGNDYSCTAALKGGELTANGQPVPLPF